MGWLRACWLCQVYDDSRRLVLRVKDSQSNSTLGYKPTILGEVEIEFPTTEIHTSHDGGQ